MVSYVRDCCTHGVATHQYTAVYIEYIISRWYVQHQQLAKDLGAAMGLKKYTSDISLKITRDSVCKPRSRSLCSPCTCVCITYRVIPVFTHLVTAESSTHTGMYRTQNPPGTRPLAAKTHSVIVVVGVVPMLLVLRSYQTQHSCDI